MCFLYIISTSHSKNSRVELTQTTAPAPTHFKPCGGAWWPWTGPGNGRGPTGTTRGEEVGVGGATGEFSHDSPKK